MEHSLTPGISHRLRQGDPEAIESVVDAFHGPIYRYLVCRGSTVPQAEELTAETFFQFLKSISSFRGNDDQIRAFVFSTARHVRANSYRRSSKDACSLDTEIAMEDSRASPLSQLLTQERNTEVTRAIGCLSETAREVIILRFVESLSVSEIAKVCDMPTGTVKSHLHRAREQLKNQLSDSEPLT